jgi:hypothetical protein
MSQGLPPHGYHYLSYLLLALFVMMLLLLVVVPSLHVLLLLPYRAVPGLGGAHMIIVPVMWWVDSTIVRPIEVALAVTGRNRQLFTKFRLLVNFGTFCYFPQLLLLFGLVQACTSQKSLLQVY